MNLTNQIRQFELFRKVCLAIIIIGFFIAIIGVWFSLQIGILGILFLIIGLFGISQPNL